MDLSNHSYTVGDHNITFTTGQNNNVTVFLGSLNVILVCVTNTLLLATILSSAPLRRQFRVQLIVCASITDLIAGDFVGTFFIVTVVYNKWYFGCPFHYLIQIFGVFADIFLTLWYLVLLNISFFVSLMHIRLPQLSPLGDKLFRTMVFSFPVFLFCVVGLPIIFTHPQDVLPSNAEYCPMYLEDPYEVAMSFVCFFIPATSLSIFIVVFVIFRKETTLSRDAMVQNLLDEPSMVERPLFYVLPSFTVVLLGFPEQLASTLFFSGMLYVPRKVFMAFSIMEFMRPGILPFMWLIFPDIRQAFVRLIRCKLCKSPNAPMTVTNISYRNLQAN